MNNSPLRLARRRQGITQADLAAAAKTSTSAISRIENEGVPAAEVARRVVELLGHAVTLDQVCFPSRYKSDIQASPSVSS